MAWWNSHKYNSYSDLVALWKTCRNKEKGKPLTTGHRLHLEGDKFTIAYVGHPIAHITPDNTIELVNGKLSVALYRLLPILVMRHGTNKYRVDHINTVKTQPDYSYWMAFDEFRSEAHPQYYEGIKFNLLTGECLNRLPDLKHRAIPEVSRQWKRDIRAWRKGWTVRQRMGVTEGYEREIVNQEHNTLIHSLLNQPHKTRLERVVGYIKAQDFSVEAYVYLRHYGSMYNPNLDVDAGVDYLLNRYRDELRHIYGVFG